MIKIWEAIKRAAIWLRRVLEDAEGVPSSKRIQSFILIAGALVVAFVMKDPVVTGVLLGAALGLQGITAFQR
jgi:hypothetical protein